MLWNYVVPTWEAWELPSSIGGTNFPFEIVSQRRKVAGINLCGHRTLDHAKNLSVNHAGTS